ncbi:helix-turn-helix domain-containing protein [Pseudobacteriovorax antillogorgiicola]|uniref:Helix-turn-helix n=1 Tax=Pseudobacteriovorax antillogorgiicola TaxID=1513793 RepID=A0A1Y6BD98_9BACT|nr:helix-turn-helix transcriptional regulator [Pseudobacteriovorax antillogorgiicola]TCS58783.1 helix-turn-helix protein [Pseudobacteriovorax antillogorgiicola]SME94763.1 Helix-turn-helix [Pseudobacteriovorax antillogorgiicola]
MPKLKNLDKRKQLRTDLYQRLEAGDRIPVVLKDLRRILSKSQDEFAAFCGISVSVLRRIEQDKGGYSIESLNRILEKFDFEVVVRKKAE